MAISTPLRTAILGCGGRGREHVPAILADDRLQLVALADAKIEAADAMAADFSLEVSRYTDIQALLDTEKPDVVVIALWTDLHLPVTQACVDAGVKVILSEKPMAATWSECRALAELAESSGAILTYCHQRRFASGNLAVREEIAAGRFGKIERMDLFSPPHLLDCGSHSVDQALSFNGESEVEWVHGAVDLSDTVSFFNIKAEIMFTGLFRFANGVMATIRCGRKDMEIWGGVRVTGSEGFVEVMWDGEIRRAVVYADPTWQFPAVVEDRSEQMRGVVRNAIDAFVGGFEPELSWRRAMRATEVLYALYESAKRRERVDLPLVGVEGNPLYEMLG